MVNDNVHYTLVEKLDGSHASANALKTSGSVIDLLEGQVALVNEQGTCVATTTDAGIYYLARKINGKIEKSPEFLKEHILHKGSQAYAAATNKLSYLGYNGVSGSFVVADSTAYTVNVIIRDTLTTFGNKEMYKFGTYKTGVSATGLEACIGLVDNLVKNFSREPEKTIQFEVLSGDAGVAIVNNVDVVNGSYTVTFTAGDLSAGDYLRLGTDVTDNVYKVISTPTTTTAILDRAVTEATASIGSETVTASDVAGIKFVGVEKTRFEPGLWKFEPADFDVTPLENVAAVTDSVAANKGIGTWQTVAEDEWFAQGNRGYGNRTDGMIPYSGPKLGYIEDEQYSTLSFKFKDQRFINIVGQSPASLISVTLYGSAATVAALLADL